MRPAVRHPLTGALLTPLAVVALLVALGYDPSPLAEVFTGDASPLGLAWLTLPLAAFGGGSVVALRNDVWVGVYAAGTVLVLAAVTGLFAGGPAYRTVFSFNAAASLVSAGGSVAVLVESVVRYRAAVRRSVSPRPLRWAARVGAIHAVVVVALRTAVLSSMNGDGTVQVLFGGLGPVTLAWTALGGFVLGAVPTYLLYRSRLVTPVLLVGSLSVVSSATTVLDELARADSGAVSAAALTPLTAYLVGWVAVLAVVSVVGALEYVLREQSGISPPRPLRIGEAAE
ncbi:hypothetical protein [Halomarina oriensis]|uniref:Uncharacterized protein n=1 Tax=Halomarina oriensis TaxID=671145 RepID=A0A6B0GL24_9EURY|nr:hypothetical protein [Halomarina oriensis]MWG35562.1 hypothetical protein [Halomarina oriensis]